MERSTKFNMRIHHDDHLLSDFDEKPPRQWKDRPPLPRSFRMYREVFEKASHTFGWLKYRNEVFQAKKKGQKASRTGWKLAVDASYAATFLSQCESIRPSDGEGHYGPSPAELLLCAERADGVGTVHRLLKAIAEVNWPKRRIYLGKVSRRRANLPTGALLFGMEYNIKYSSLKALSRVKSKKLRLALRMLLAAENKTALSIEDWKRAIAAAAAPAAIPDSWLSRVKFLNAAWLLGFGRIPKNASIRRGFLQERESEHGMDIHIPRFRAAAQHSKAFIKGLMGLLELIQADDEGLYQPHDVLAVFRLAIHLGANAVNIVRKTGLSVHDAGIGLPDVYPVDAQVAGRFLAANAVRWTDAVMIYKNWAEVGSEGIDPTSPQGFVAALTFIKASKYRDVHQECVKLAAEFAAVGYSQWEFQDTQSWYLSMLESGSFPPAYETLPLGLKAQGDEGLSARFLERGDFKALVIGEYTGCCHHIGGAGSSCAKHSFSAPEGAVLVIEHKGKIAFQSWVWRNGDDVVFDNVEGNIKDHLRESAKRLYADFAKQLIGKLGIKRVWVGANHSDLEFEGSPVPKGPGLPAGYVGYSDARNKWLIAGVAEGGDHEE